MPQAPRVGGVFGTLPLPHTSEYFPTPIHDNCATETAVDGTDFVILNCLSRFSLLRSSVTE